MPTLGPSTTSRLAFVAILPILASTGCPDSTTPLEPTDDTGEDSTGDDTGTVSLSVGETADPMAEDSSGGPSTVCGDGMVEGDEDCDDAGESATCNADCTAAACGDGVVNAAAGEVCDAGGETPECDADCTPAECGDGVVNSMAGETCDDEGPSDTCNADCMAVSCGDGYVDPGEECDDAGFSFICDDDCTFTVCGDQVVNRLVGEVCDEGPDSATCDIDCTLPMCQDGVLNEAAGEICDDGSQTATCDLDCTPAECGDGHPNGLAGEQCDTAGESAFCNPDCTISVCGDGVHNASSGELCDDGETTAACDPDCTFPECGDGVPNAPSGEQCDTGGASMFCAADCTYPECEPAVHAELGAGCPGGAAGATCSTLLLEGFADNSLGWTLDTEWEIGSATASVGGVGNPDPATDHTPTADNGVAGVVIGGNAGTGLHDFYWLTSPPFSSAGYDILVLDLWRWLNSDYTPYMQNRIEVWDGASWVTVWQSAGPPALQDGAWTNVRYDVSAHANAAMQIRIGFNINSGGVYTCSQWNVDDISVWGVICP